MADAPVEAARPRRSRVLLRVAVAVVLLAGLALAVADQWSEVAGRLGRLRPGPAVLALVLLVAGLQTSMLAWRAVLADLGSPLPVSTAARIIYVAQLGKYLPGSVWPIVLQMQLGRAVGVPRTRAAAASLVMTGLAVVTGALVGLLSLPALLGGGGGRYALLLLAVPVGAVLLHPRVINRMITVGLRVLRRPPLEHGLSGSGLLAAAGFFVASYLLFGLQAFVLAVALGGAGSGSVVLAVGGFALATAAGLAFVVAPAGAGVREAVLVLVLGTAISVPAATAVAIASRLLSTLADALVAGVAALSARALLRRRPRQQGFAEGVPARRNEP